MILVRPTAESAAKTSKKTRYIDYINAWRATR